MEQLEILENLKLNLVSEDWVNLIWNDNFITFPEPPDEYNSFLDNENFNSLLKEINKVTKNWIRSDSDEVSWRTLKATNLNVKTLLVVLGKNIKIVRKIKKHFFVMNKNYFHNK